jgi:hypothetical protein
VLGDEAERHRDERARDPTTLPTAIAVPLRSGSAA